MYCYTCKESQDKSHSANVSAYIFSIADIGSHDLSHSFESLEGFRESILAPQLKQELEDLT